MGHAWDKYYTDDARNFDLEKMPFPLLHQAVDRAAMEFGATAALTTALPNGAEGTIDYIEYRKHVRDFASYLREVLGLQTGDTVALMTPNCIGFAIASMGVAMAGCVLTNVNPLYTEPEMEHQLIDSNAKVLVIIDLFGDKVDTSCQKRRFNTL